MTLTTPGGLIDRLKLTGAFGWWLGSGRFLILVDGLEVRVVLTGSRCFCFPELLALYLWEPGAPLVGLYVTLSYRILVQRTSIQHP